MGFEAAEISIAFAARRGKSSLPIGCSDGVSHFESSISTTASKPGSASLSLDGTFRIQGLNRRTHGVQELFRVHGLGYPLGPDQSDDDANLFRSPEKMPYFRLAVEE